MSKHVEPAMTREQWGDPNELFEWTGIDARAIDRELGGLGKHRKALAALLLHGYFTWEDVEMLRQVACCPGHLDLCRALADRIEALLPPEDHP